MVEEIVMEEVNLLEEKANVKEKARKSRKANRYERVKREKSTYSVNYALGPRVTRKSKRAWHKSQRRKEIPEKSYKGNYALKDVYISIY